MLKTGVARCGIRTHEANARGLKSRPFDRSGNLALILLNSLFIVKRYFFKLFFIN
jgi:hypothetical protein